MINRTAVRWWVLAGLGSAMVLVPACSSDSSDTSTPTSTGTDAGTTGDASTPTGTDPLVDGSTIFDASKTETSTCDGGTTLCGTACVDTTDNANCGACGNACGTSETCATDTCQILPTGSGADGVYAPTADAILNAVHIGGAAGIAGQKVVAVTDGTGFAAGDLVLVHQSRGAGAGKYEFAQIGAIGAAGQTLTLLHNLANTYSSTGDADRAQVVKVPQYTTVTVETGITVTAPAWDGASGGILAFKATGAITVTGTLDMNGRGFQGYSHASLCVNTFKYFCSTADTADGFAGESATGPSQASVAANGAGGGGGSDGQDCGGGGGGAYGAVGTAGSNGGGGNCRDNSHIQPGGAGGAATGAANLTTSLLFGGAGGEGGADEDGAYPGKGGNGGGIIAVTGASIAVTGAITSNGAAGGDGVQNDVCGGGGSGMGAGGGGSGGAIHLRATGTVDVGTSVTATGSGGGLCGATGNRNVGTGGDGRIGAAGTTVTGTTTPAADTN